MPPPSRRASSSTGAAGEVSGPGVSRCGGPAEARRRLIRRGTRSRHVFSPPPFDARPLVGDPAGELGLVPLDRSSFGPLQAPSESAGQSRQTEALDSDTPVTRSTTKPTRSRVHRSASNPSAWAPRSNSALTLSTWASSSLGGRPVAVRRRNAWAPLRDHHTHRTNEKISSSRWRGRCWPSRYAGEGDREVTESGHRAGRVPRADPGGVLGEGDVPDVVRCLDVPVLAHGSGELGVGRGERVVAGDGTDGLNWLFPLFRSRRRRVTLIAWAACGSRSRRGTWTALRRRISSRPCPLSRVALPRGISDLRKPCSLGVFGLHDRDVVGLLLLDQKLHVRVLGVHRTRRCGRPGRAEREGA